MERFLVVSYDPDQQQWFYDVVFADSQDAAKEKLLGIREYCMDADALTMEDIARFAADVPNVSFEQSESDLADFKREITFE